MKRNFALILLTLCLIAGCSSSKNNPTAPDPAGAQAEADAGDAALASGNVASANLHYKAALAKDPTNPQANSGAAITEIYLLQQDPEIGGVIDQFDARAPKDRGLETEQAGRAQRLMGRLAGSAHSFDPLSSGRMVGRVMLEAAGDPVTASQIQNLIKTRVLPQLAYAELRLNIVENHPEFVHRLPPAATGEPDTLELDLGEIYALDAVLNSVQAWLGVVVAYDLDGANESANPESLLAPGTDFGTLHSDGTAQLALARGNFLTSKVRLDQMVAFIGSETDDQSDDIIPAGVLTEPGFVEFMTAFTKVQTSMSEPVDVVVQTYASTEMTVQIEIGEFFSHPIADWKTKLPAHTFDDQHEPVITSPLTFPDPTFNDIFPNMTNGLWQELLGPVEPGVHPGL